MNASERRIAWIDVARGLGIILVVYGHALRGVLASHLVITSKAVLASDYTIYTFHMPLFFVLAGLNVDHSLRKGKSAFLQGKLWTILYPYFLWSLIQGSIEVLFSKYLNGQRSLAFLTTMAWRPAGQFWFLYVLFCCHVLAWLCGGRRSVLLSLGALSIVGTLFLPTGVWNAIAHSFPFYVAGIVFSSALRGWQPSQLAALACSGACGMLLWVSSSFGRAHSGGNPSALISWFATVAGICLILSLSHLLVQSSERLADGLEVLGRASLTIYILHVLAASGTRVLLKQLHVLQWEPQLLLGTLAGLLFPLGTHIWLQRRDLLATFALSAPRFTALMKSPVTRTSDG